MFKDPLRVRDLNFLNPGSFSEDFSEEFSAPFQKTISRVKFKKFKKCPHDIVSI